MTKKDKDPELTMWGRRPGQSITNRGVTRRDIPKIVAKTLTGIAVIADSNPDGADVTLHTKKH